MIDAAVAAIRAGDVVILPTDTVYGLCSAPAAVEKLSRLKRRDPEQPIALVAGEVDVLLDAVPELDARIVRALLPGAYTLVLANPARRFPSLTGSRPETIGVRVPALAGAAKEVFDRLGAIAATSANVHGSADPRSVADIPRELRDGVAAVVDVGELPGTASTVVDFTGAEPRILREGAGDVGRALAAARGPRE